VVIYVIYGIEATLKNGKVKDANTEIDPTQVVVANV
jgi:hypothetical protein